MKTKHQSLALAILFALSACEAQFQISGPSELTGHRAAAVSASDAQPDQPKNVPVKQVQIMSGENLVLNQGDKVELSANVIYADHSRDSALVWTSSDNTVVTVNATTGSISATKPGIATISARSARDTHHQASLTVTVKKADVLEVLTRITPEAATLTPGETVQLQASILLSDGSLSPNVIWRSSNAAVAVVSNGLVVAAGKGTATITAIAAGDSTRTASAAITVN